MEDNNPVVVDVDDVVVVVDEAMVDVVFVVTKGEVRSTLECGFAIATHFASSIIKY